MAVMLSEVPFPLNWDRDGNRLQVPAEAVGWKVRRATHKPGRPSYVPGEQGGPLQMALDADMTQLRAALRGETGGFYLSPIDRFGNDLEPVAYVEVIPLTNPTPVLGMVPAAHAAPLAPEMPEAETVNAFAQIPLRLFDLFGQMLASRDAHDEIMSGMLKTLVSSTATIQQSTAGLLNAANTTVRVANGVEALERPQPQPLDIDGLADKVAAIGKLRDVFGAQDGKSETPWFIQLLNGPVGMGLMKLANDFGKLAAAQAAAAQAAADEASDEE